MAWETLTSQPDFIVSGHLTLSCFYLQWELIDRNITLPASLPCLYIMVIFCFAQCFVKSHAQLPVRLWCQLQPHLARTGACHHLSPSHLASCDNIACHGLRGDPGCDICMAWTIFNQDVSMFGDKSSRLTPGPCLPLIADILRALLYLSVASWFMLTHSFFKNLNYD